MNKGLHIGFTGTDGAGKSTQAGKLNRRFNKTGHMSYYFEGKEDFTVQVMRSVVAKHGKRSVRSYFGSEAVDFAWAFDTLRDQIHMVVPLKASGCVVVHSRTGYDRIALARTFGDTNVQQIEEVTLLAGGPDLTVFLDVPIDVAIRRINARALDSEDPEMLTKLRNHLVEMSDELPWLRIDGDGTPEEVHERVWTAVSAWIEREQPELARIEGSWRI